MFIVVFDPRVYCGEQCYFVNECAGMEEVLGQIEEWNKKIRKKYPNTKDFEYKIYETSGVIDIQSFKKAV